MTEQDSSIEQDDKIEYDDDAVVSLWSQWLGQGNRSWSGMERFRRFAAERLTDPDDADKIAQCSHCGDVRDEDYVSNIVAGEDSVCDSCFNDSSQCSHCEEYHWRGDSWETLHGSSICDGCRDEYYYYCDECDGYYHADEGCPNEHESDCACEAPHFRFSMPHGDERLTNDTRASISLPAGTISDEGLKQIGWTLRRIGQDIPLVLEDPSNVYSCYTQESLDARNKWFELSYSFADAIGSEWTRKDGNFPKRLSRYAYKTHGLKLDSDLMTKIGNFGRDHSLGKDYAIEITRELNLPAEEFAHEDSCWWQSYAYSRCTLKSNGGFGLRSFTAESWGSGVSGRAWVMPMRKQDDGDLMPTHDSEGADVFLVFNGYGDLNGYAAPRIVAQMAGMTYRKITLSINPMYVNGDSGYIVAPEDIAQATVDAGQVRLMLEQHALEGTVAA